MDSECTKFMIVNTVCFEESYSSLNKFSASLFWFKINRAMELLKRWQAIAQKKVDYMISMFHLYLILYEFPLSKIQHISLMSHSVIILKNNEDENILFGKNQYYLTKLALLNNEILQTRGLVCNLKLKSINYYIT